MKRIIFVLVGLFMIGGLAYLAMYMNTSSKVSDTSLIAFAIEDTASVDRIELYDSFSDQDYTLTRKKGGKWKGTNGECVQQSIVEMMLETMNKVTLRGYVPQAAMSNMKRLLMAQHKRVKIYQNGKWTKTWYVGHSTQDHMGTHMLLETPNAKSDNPVIMGMKGFYGILEPRFFADSRKFACTDLFSYKRKELKSIEVINRATPADSYSIKINGPDDYVVTSQGEVLTNVNKENLVYYLNTFENIHFNQHNYTLSQKEMDSMKAMVPDYELNIEGTTKDYHLRMLRRLDPEYNPKDTLVYDTDYLWAINEEGQVVRMQYYTVTPLIQGKVVFEEQ